MGLGRLFHSFYGRHEIFVRSMRNLPLVRICPGFQWDQARLIAHRFYKDLSGGGVKCKVMIGNTHGKHS